MKLWVAVTKAYSPKRGLGNGGGAGWIGIEDKGARGVGVILESNKKLLKNKIKQNAILASEHASKLCVCEREREKESKPAYNTIKDRILPTAVLY